MLDRHTAHLLYAIGDSDPSIVLTTVDDNKVFTLEDGERTLE